MAGFNNESFKVVIGHAVFRAIGGVKEISFKHFHFLFNVLLQFFMNGSEYFFEIL